MNPGPYANAPFERRTEPLSPAELRRVQNQYKILLVLPAIFVGLFFVTWHFNPPAVLLDWFYVVAMAIGIAVATGFIVKYIRKSDVVKVYVRGVVSEKPRQGRGSDTEYYLRVGGETVRVPERDYEAFEVGDLVAMEFIDVPGFRKPKIEKLGRMPVE
jgi:hypothetical protein